MSDLDVSTSAYSKPLYLGCTLDTSVDVNAMSVSVYKEFLHDYNLSKLGPVQSNLRVNDSTNMTVMGTCVLYYN